MKVPQFVIKYANYKIDSIWSNNLMQERYKNDKINTITRAVSALENDRIAIDETMNLISKQ